MAMMVDKVALGVMNAMVFVGLPLVAAGLLTQVL
jgi:hypothetical protein